MLQKKAVVLHLLLAAAVIAPVTIAICADRSANTAANQPTVVAISQVTHDGVSKTKLLSDGSTLYITESSAANHSVAKVSLRTSDRSLLSTSFSSVQALDISPDHKTILISSSQGTANANELWALPLGTGSAVRLGELTGREASWSRDGQRLVFGKASTVYTAHADGTSAREVFTATGSVFAPRISPDGKRIRFTVGHAESNTTSLWEINVDGSQPHTLLETWSNASAACCGSWTADGRYYIFQVTQGTLTTLWALADKDVTTPIQLTGGPTSFGNASLSDDKKNIWAIGVQPTAEAVSYKSNDGTFASLLAGTSATDVDFSPDGKWAAYISIPERDLWICRADGSHKQKLSSGPESAALPRWSPDSTQVAYARLLPGQPSKIALVSRDGGPPQDLLVEDRSQIDANWSADGTRIMIGSFNHDKSINIRVVNIKTHNIEVVPGSDGAFSPRWSPDSRYIAALSPDSTKVLLFDYQTQKWTTWLTEPAGAVSYPVWSADSQYLYFDDLVTGVESIRKAKVGDQKTESVFTLPSFERYPGPFGLWSGRTPGGAWMFVRDRSTQEVYQLTVSLP